MSNETVNQTNAAPVASAAAPANVPAQPTLVAAPSKLRRRLMWGGGIVAVTGVAVAAALFIARKGSSAAVVEAAAEAVG